MGPRTPDVKTFFRQVCRPMPALSGTLVRLTEGGAPARLGNCALTLFTAMEAA